MRPLCHYPLSTFCDAAESTVGWLLVIFATSFLGLWLGMWIGLGELPGFEWIAWGPLLLLWVFVWFPYLPFMTLLLWYLPHRYESLRLRLGAAVVNCLAWVGFCAWAFRSLPRWWEA